MYGNYDTKNLIPKFDLYLGVNYWATVEFINSSPISKEILHIPTTTYTYVCLVNTGQGVPFISALELRLVDDDVYPSGSDSLELYARYDLRSFDNKAITRYNHDIYDRIWRPSFFEYGVSELISSVPIGPEYQNSYKLPSDVMSTAIRPENASDSLDFYWIPRDPTVGFYVYMHFAELLTNKSREFNITINKFKWYSDLVPDYLSTTTIYSVKPQTPEVRVNFSLIKTENSILPPILNALELYTVKDLSGLQTDQNDVDAIKNIKAVYGVDKNWQGDPCTPNAYSWEGVGCFNASFVDSPRIVSLNLSMSGLTGNISTFISNLKMLKYLDLSNNNLTGNVPDFLTQLQNLVLLDLSWNNFTGTVPAKLLERSNSKALSLSLEGNPNLCKLATSCEDRNAPPPSQVNEKKDTKKSSNMVIIIVAITAVVIVILIAFVILWVFFLKKRKSPPPPQQPKVVSVATESSSKSNSRDTPIKSNQQKISYSDVLKITKKFQKPLGKGGFGTVYHGRFEDTEVAVKMLSESSTQGYKQFMAEAELLTRVHHKNLTSLVGYCDEGDKLGLIYEYMANGDLRSHLSERSLTFLSWETRLEIAVDAAQGLEYLHTGCTPPIIHRDVKSTNILLNGEFHAKLADFGLSRVVQTEGSTHMSTAYAGTFGYLDPEYKLNKKSDVFSFGVVLLEIITGKSAIIKNYDNTQIHITNWVTSMLKTKGDVKNVMDPRLGQEYDETSVWKAIDVATECVSNASDLRPNMNLVVIELRECLLMEKGRLKKGYRGESNHDSAEISSLNIEITGMGPYAR